MASKPKKKVDTPDRSSVDIEKLKNLNRYFKPIHRAFIFAALEYFTCEQIAIIIKKEVRHVRSYVKIMGGKEFLTERVAELHTPALIEKRLYKTQDAQKKRNRARAVFGTRDDLGISLRSKMEANVARVLNQKYGKGSWSYEAEWFKYEIRGKTRAYLPDFHIKTENEDFYIEVKGRFNPHDKEKIKKFIYEENKDLIIVRTKYNKDVESFVQRYEIDSWIYEDLKAEWEAQCDIWE